MGAEPLYSSPKCVICASDLDPRARKCVKCDAYQDGRHCKACGLTIPAEAIICPSCKTLQVGATCHACGETIDEGARRCSACEAWQKGFRRYFAVSEVTLALIASIIAVLGAIITPVANYFGNRSATSIRVIGDATYRGPNDVTEEQTISVLVVNTGKRESMFQRAEISFDDALGAVTPTTLELMNKGDVFIEPGSHKYLHFTATVRCKKKDSTKKGVPKTDVKKTDVTTAAAAPGREATVTIFIAETNWRDVVKDKPRRDIFPLSKIPNWMANHVESD